MKIQEVCLTDEVLEELIALSRQWEAENSCYGYRANTREDIEDNRIFLAQQEGETIGYLFGKLEKASRMASILPDGTPYFELEELYVIPQRRSGGVGRALFGFVENVLRSEEVGCIVLSTATKNHRAILHFYLDELGMEFWSARLFKRLT